MMIDAEREESRYAPEYKDAKCNFCYRHIDNVTSMIVSKEDPENPVYICGHCVEEAYKAITKQKQE